MKKWKFNESHVEQGIQALAGTVRFPELTIQAGSNVLKRHQKKIFKCDCIRGTFKSIGLRPL